MEYSGESIFTQWQNMISGNPIDPVQVRPEILISWEDCLAKGVDAYGEMSRCDDLEMILQRSAELIAVAKPFMEMINEVIAGSGMRIDCIDFEGFFLCSCGDPVLMRESEMNGLVTGCDVGLDTLGTNAAGLCLSLKRPVQVLGCEHFNRNLHNLNCSATPIYAPGSVLLGALNILSYAAPQNRQTLGLTKSVAMSIEKQIALSRTVKSLKISNTQLNTIMEYLPQGVISLSNSGEIDDYNQKVLEMFNIAPNINGDIRTEKIKQIIHQLPVPADNMQLSDRECTITIGKRKKSFLVNTRRIGGGEKTLLLVEESSRIMNLSAVQSNRTSYTFDDIIGNCPEIQKAIELASMVANTNSSVLLVGESGAGKELFAQAIHAASDRCRHPFVAINCGAIPADIIESELFGYEPGAFTGAREAGKAGRLEAASGGTLFLDEVEAMPLSFQVKLLRAFSSKSIVRVGGVNEIPVDIRIISASKVDLQSEINAGRFREDLYYRIATFPLEIPPLHKRGGDIKLLAKQFLGMLQSDYVLPELSADEPFFEALESHSWRGNVRELRNTIERAVLMSLGKEKLAIEHLPESIQHSWMTKKLKKRAERTIRQEPDDQRSYLKIVEDTAIAMVLEEERGNITRSAKRLGIARSTLYQKIHASPHLVSVAKSNTSPD